MMPKLEYVIKLLEVKKEEKNLMATSPHTPQTKTTSPETQPKTCITE